MSYFAGRHEVDPLARSRVLHAEASRLLDDLGLRGVLASFGRVEVHGSYALDLLTWRDLDVYVVAPVEALSLGRFFEMGQAIAAHLVPHRMQFRDETGEPHPGLPRGRYWGIYLRDTDEPGWKIDVWAIDQDEHDRLRSYEAWVVSRLTPDHRSAILEIKAAVHTHPHYRRGFSARTIYDAVLGAGVTTLHEFAVHLEKTAGVRLEG